MRAVGVTPEFVREMRRQGLSAREPDEAVEGRLFASSASAVAIGSLDPDDADDRDDEN
jgi:hypothetical protein